MDEEDDQTVVQDNVAVQDNVVEQGLQDTAVVQNATLQECPDVSIGAIRDGVVSQRTRLCYLRENFVFLFYFCTENSTALTPFALRRLNAMYEAALPELTGRQFYCCY
jgi:hypothetical protein